MNTNNKAKREERQKRIINVGKMSIKRKNAKIK